MKTKPQKNTQKRRKVGHHYEYRCAAKCKRWLHYDDFYLDTRYRWGIAPACRACRIADATEQRVAFMGGKKVHRKRTRANRIQREHETRLRDGLEELRARNAARRSS